MGPAGDIVGVEIRSRDGRCDGCGGELGPGNWIRIVPGPSNQKLALCMSCAGLRHLVRLPPGDPALTRRAKKHSSTHAVVVRWARARRRYERQGWLVEPEALKRAALELDAEGRPPKWVDMGDHWARREEPDAKKQNRAAGRP